MTKRFRMYTKIRTDTMENIIAWQEFTGEYDAAAVLRELCNTFGIPVREDKIAFEREERKRINRKIAAGDFK